MKAVFASVPEHILEWRRQRDADQWDEMWEGVLHMAPSPNRDHQTFEYKLHRWLDDHWAEPNGCRVYPQINVADPDAAKWTENYRIPDLVLLSPSRFEIDRNEYFNGGPDAVVEIHSPGDEAHEKLDFYAAVGVREVWIIDRDSKRPEVFCRAGNKLVPRKADADGWVGSEVVGAEFRAAGEGKLEIRLIDKHATTSKLP